MSEPNTIQIGRGRKRKPQIVALMSLEIGQSYIHEHVDAKSGEPMKTSFAGWLAIQRQRFKKNYQGKQIQREEVLSPSGKAVAAYEITVIEFPADRKPRKPRAKKVAAVEVSSEAPAVVASEASGEAAPVAEVVAAAEAPPAEAPPAEAPPAEAPPAEAPPAAPVEQKAE